MSGSELYKIKLVIFDIDGTLLKLPIRWSEALAHVAKLYRTKKKFLGLLAEIEGKEIFDRINRILERYELEASENPVLYEDVQRTVEGLSKNFVLAYVTMQSRIAARRVLERAGLAKYAKCLVTREDAAVRLKQILLVTKRLGFRAEETVFVGDKLNDVCSALVAKIQPILVVRGEFHSRISDTDDLEEDLEALGVPVVSTLDEVPRLITEFSKHGPLCISCRSIST